MPRPPWFRPSPLLVLALLFVGPVRLLPAFDLAGLAYYRLGLERGLAGSRVDCMIQDRRGLLWFGGEGGLSRFDGRSFSTYRPRIAGADLGSTPVVAILEDDDATLLVGLEGGGLYRFDPERGVFEVCRLADSSGAKEGGPKEGRLRITTLAKDRQGRIFAGSAEGMVYRETGPLSFAPVDSFPRGPAVSGLIADAKGQLWVGTEGAGLFLFDGAGQSLAHWRHLEGDASSLGGDSITSLYEDLFGGLWIGFQDGSVDLETGGGFRHSSSAAGRPRGSRPIRALAEDFEGRIWVGTEDSLANLDAANLILSPPLEEPGLDVRALMADRRGLMWVGLGAGGIRSYNPRSALFRRFPGGSAAEGADALAGLASAGGKAVFLAFGSGLWTMAPEPGSKPRPLAVAAAGRGRIDSILEGRDGTLWIGWEGGGLTARSPDGRSRLFSHRAGEESSIALGAVRPLFEDADGSLWLAVRGAGLDHLSRDGRRFEHYPPGAKETAPGFEPRAVARDAQGVLWAGSADSGLSRFNPATARFETFSAGSVTSLLADPAGRLWIGSLGAGFWCLDAGSAKARPVRGPEGLIGDSVYRIVQARDGVLWLLSSRGLVSYEPGAEAFFLFGEEDGLPAGALANAFLAQGGDGRMWLSTQSGLCSFDPLTMTRYAPQPDILITGIESSGGRGPRASPDGSRIILDHDNGGLSFRIAVIDYIAPARNRYAFKLEGLQTGWSSLGDDNAGHLAALTPGDYMLRVRASNGNGVWNDYGASLALTVLPPFWGTWWFRVGAGLALLSLAGFIVALRIRGLRGRNRLLVKFARHVEEAREEERKTAARDVHDVIGQDLMVLNINAFWLATHGTAPLEEREARVSALQDSVLAAMASVKAIATKLRPEAIDALEFPDALRWYLRNLGRVGGLEIAADIQDSAPSLDPELANALYRILQEMLGNVIRHAGAARVEVRFAAEDGEILLEVRDDGRGMEKDLALAADSFGIIGMRERCATFGGRLELESEEGKGTTVRARIPLGPRPPDEGSGQAARSPRFRFRIPAPFRRQRRP
jgi:signal transduction histidine kinase/ligand-binding sensor domain-containing protein